MDSSEVFWADDEYIINGVIHFDLELTLFNFGIFPKVFLHFFSFFDSIAFDSYSIKFNWCSLNVSRISNKTTSIDFFGLWLRCNTLKVKNKSNCCQSIRFDSRFLSRFPIEVRFTLIWCYFLLFNCRTEKSILWSPTGFVVLHLRGSILILKLKV